MAVGRRDIAGLVRQIAPAGQLAQAGAPLALAACALDGGFGSVLIAMQALLPDRLHAGASAAGYALALYGATRVLLQTPGSWLARRAGPRSVIVGGLVAAGAAVGGLAAAGAAWQAYLLVFAYGAATALAWPAIYLSAAELVPDERGALFGFVTLCALAGGAAGLGLSTLLVDRTSPRLLLAAAAGTLALGGLGVALLFRRLHGTHGPAGSAPRPRLGLPRRGGLRWLLLALLFQGIGGSMLLPLLRQYAHERLHVQMQELALVLAPAGPALIGTLLVAGRASDRLGRARVVALGSVLAAAGILVLANTSARGLVALGVLPLAAGYAACATAINAWISDAAEGPISAMGLSLTVQGVAFALGPALTGLLIAHGGLGAALWVAALAWLPAGLCALAPRPDREVRVHAV